MARVWPKALPLVGVGLGLYLAAALGLGLGLTWALPNPTFHQRLTHPVVWLAQALGTGLDLSLTLGLLWIHQWAESAQESSDPDASSK